MEDTSVTKGRNGCERGAAHGRGGCGGTGKRPELGRGDDQTGDSGTYPCTGGYNNYSCRNMRCGRRLGAGRTCVGGLLGPFYFIRPVINVGGPLCCHRGIRTTFSYAEHNRVITKTCEGGARSIISVRDYVVRSRRSSRVVESVGSVLHSFEVGACSRSANCKLLERILIEGNCTAKRVVMILILTSPVLPSGGGFMGTLEGGRPGVAAIILGIGSGGADVILKSEGVALCNGNFVRSGLYNYAFHVSPNSFCRIGPMRARLLCRGTVRRTRLANGRHMVSTCYNAKAVNVVTTGGTNRIVKIRLGHSTVHSTIAGTGQGSVEGVHFCGSSTKGFVIRVTRGNRGTSIIVVSPPEANDSRTFLSSIIGLSPREIICISYNPRALTESLGCLAGRKCTIGHTAPCSYFPCARRVRAIILLYEWVIGGDVPVHHRVI